MENKANLLLVDDEPRILRTLSMVFKRTHNVYIAESGQEALTIINNNKIHVVVSDQRMPGMTGSELLKQVKEQSPGTMRLLLTGYSELNAIINSINEGEVFRFISKPWHKPKLIETVEKATQIAVDIENNNQSPAVDEKKKLPVPSFMVLDEDLVMHDLIDNIIGSKAKVIHHQKIQDAIEAMSLIDVDILISDIQLGNEDISDMLNLLKQENPKLTTIVVTEFSDTNKLVELINHGQIFRFLPKPARKGMLIQSINSSIKNYRLLQQPEHVKRFEVEIIDDKRQQKVPVAIIEKLKNLRKKKKSSAAVA